MRTVQAQGAAAQHGGPVAAAPRPVGPARADANGPPSRDDFRSRWARELYDGAVQETSYLRPSSPRWPSTGLKDRKRFAANSAPGWGRSTQLPGPAKHDQESE